MDDRNQTKTFEEIAQEARAAGRDAARAAQGIASEAQAIGSETAADLRPHAEDAAATAQQALDTAKGVAADAGAVAQDAAQTVADRAGQRLNALKSQAADLQARSARYVAEQPVQATLIAITVGAVATAALLSLLRGQRD